MLNIAIGIVLAILFLGALRFVVKLLIYWWLNK